jgi:hypothetical protein
MPPPPDLFPVDWEMANAVMAAVADPEVSRVLANMPPSPSQEPEPVPGPSNRPCC